MTKAPFWGLFYPFPPQKSEVMSKSPLFELRRSGGLSPSFLPLRFMESPFSRGSLLSDFFFLGMTISALSGFFLEFFSYIC